MFRAQANQFDEAVAKATDENLTSENWSLILDVCDRVSASPTGPASAVAALIKRLSHRNANVQLYTLELANALSQNCGAPIHRELSSRSFTDALIRLAADRNAHQTVKSKVLERMEEWTEQFRGDPDLGIMEGAFERLKRSNPTLQAPDKPRKREIEDVDRKKEDEELQMALALSLKEGVKKEEKTGKVETGEEKKEEQARGTTAATVSRVRALYDFTPSEAGELAFRKGDVIAVLESVYKDWWKGSLRGNTGIFPLNYVEKLQDPTKDELEKDAMMEGEVFAQIRNVEKLLALLSVRSEGGMGSKDTSSEEEIQELYNQTLAIRPKLIELIGKYSQKKDDFTQLNEKFIKARRDYEALLESSMSQPQGGYGYPGARQPSQPYQQHPYPPQGGYPPQHTPAPYAQQRPQPQQQQPSYAAPPPQQQQFYNPPPSAAPTDPYTHANGSSSAFHFLPSGAPPPQQQPTQVPQVQLPPAQSETPKPLATAVPPVDSPYSPQPSFSNRPQSIHTLNSGNPQELATSGYESPVDNRHSYPSAQFPPQQQAQPNAQPYETKPYAGLPSQQPGFNRPQRQASFESAAPATYPPEQYQQPQQQQQQQGYPPQQQPSQAPGQAYPPQQGGGQQYQSFPPQPNQAPPAPPGQGQPQGQAPGQYRAYSPSMQGSAMPPPQAQQPQGTGGYPALGGQSAAVAGQGGADEDYYR